MALGRPLKSRIITALRLLYHEIHSFATGRMGTRLSDTTYYTCEVPSGGVLRPGGRAPWIWFSCCPPRSWRGPPFACYFPAMKSDKRLLGRPHGMLFPIAMLCNRGNFSPTFVRAKVAKPAGGNPRTPLKTNKDGASRAPYPRPRLAAACGSPRKGTLGKCRQKHGKAIRVAAFVPCGGFPRAFPQEKLCQVTALAAAGFQSAIESAAPGGKAAPTTRRGGQPVACSYLNKVPPVNF